VRRFLRDNGLSLFFGAVFLLALFGQSISGLAQYNQQQLSSGADPVSFWAYVTSSSFAVDVAENWQSEYLQFSLMIVATVWLVQRGSTESKPLDATGTESDEQQKVGRHAKVDSPSWARLGGWRTAVYSSSLAAVMGLFFVGSLLAQSIAGRAAFNADQLAQFSDPVSWTGYVTSAEFWNRTLQNWQSEFLAVCSAVLFSIYLRQRGSPESKPVGAAHEATAQEG
jgi:Domain of unknown function (DUF6766)